MATYDEDKELLEEKALNQEEILEKEKLAIKDFLRVHTAYDLLPESGKVVVIDVGLSVSSAFQALVENGVSCI